MPLDPKAQTILDNAKAGGATPVYCLSVREARERMAAGFLTKDEPERVESVIDLSISNSWGEIPIRIYNPQPERALPALIFFHGGGWVLNSIATHDSVCRRIANIADCIVIAADFRLSPEAKFPAQIDDAVSITTWALANIEKYGGAVDKVYVGGDSSGGTQAAAVCLLARDRGDDRIAGQILVYPPTDYYLPGTQSYKDFASSVIINRDFMIWSWNNYLPSDIDPSNPYISPLRAASLKNLPPALIATAEYDVLRDEAELYAKRMKEDGSEVTLLRYDGMLHGFIMQWRIMDQAIDLIEKIGAFLHADK